MCVEDRENGNHRGVGQSKVALRNCALSWAAFIYPLLRNIQLIPLILPHIQTAPATTSARQSVKKPIAESQKRSRRWLILDFLYQLI